MIGRPNTDTNEREPAEQLAERFHEAYERLATSFGYSTRPESSVPWAEVPEGNRNLMVAVIEELGLSSLVSRLAATEQELREEESRWQEAYSERTAALAVCEAEREQLREALEQCPCLYDLQVGDCRKNAKDKCARCAALASVSAEGETT